MSHPESPQGHDVKFPVGRTRFNTDETMRLIGCPLGSKCAFLDIVAETRVPSELIGNSRTYDRDAVIALRLAYIERLANSAAIAPPSGPVGVTRPSNAAGKKRPRKSAVA